LALLLALLPPEAPPLAVDDDPVPVDFPPAPADPEVPPDLLLFPPDPELPAADSVELEDRHPAPVTIASARKPNLHENHRGELI
jgi:hypothetical protein